jgi:hypothetical protein
VSQDQKQENKQVAPATDADLMQSNAMLNKRVQNLEAQLKLAVDALAKVNDQKRASDAAEKADLITHLVADSGNKLTAEALDAMSMSELKAMQIMADAAGSSSDKMFASVQALQAAQDQKNRPYLTAGYFDHKTGTYKGGV